MRRVYFFSIRTVAGLQIWVNVNQIATVRGIDTGTEIHMSNDRMYIVPESVEWVMKQLLALTE